MNKNILNFLLVSCSFLFMPLSQASDLKFYQFKSQMQKNEQISNNSVVLRLTINPDGTTSNVKLKRSSGNVNIDNAAIKWMENEIMKPVSINGKPHEFHIVKQIYYSRF